METRRRLKLTWRTGATMIRTFEKGKDLERWLSGHKRRGLLKKVEELKPVSKQRRPKTRNILDML
jgi:hypothetical protein